MTRASTQPLVRYYVAVSLDGFVAPLSGGTDWLDPYSAATAGFGRFVAGISGSIMGRTTYDQMAAFLGAGGEPTAVLTHRPLNGAPKGVVAHRSARGALDAIASQLLQGDIWLVGGGITAGTFLDLGLIDRLELCVVPTALGAGRRLFGRDTAASNWRLISTRTLGGGVVETVYEPY